MSSQTQTIICHTDQASSIIRILPVTHCVFRKCLQREIHLKQGITVKCPDREHEETKRNIKWYRFIKGNKKYVFLKLERDATVTPAHFIRAWDRYAGSAAGTYKENVFSRREDPRKDGRTSSFGQEYRKNDPEGLMYDGLSVCCSPELWEGEGDEYFLCAELSEFFHNKGRP